MIRAVRIWLGKWKVDQDISLQRMKVVQDISLQRMWVRAVASHTRAYMRQHRSAKAIWFRSNFGTGEEDNWCVRSNGSSEAGLSGGQQHSDEGDGSSEAGLSGGHQQHSDEGGSNEAGSSGGQQQRSNEGIMHTILVLNGSMSDLPTPRAQWDKALCSDIAAALGCSCERLRIAMVHEGSIIVQLEVLPGLPGEISTQQLHVRLADAVADPSSQIYTGAISADLNPSKTLVHFVEVADWLREQPTGTLISDSDTETKWFRQRRNGQRIIGQKS